MTADQRAGAPIDEAARHREPTAPPEKAVIITSLFTLHESLHQDELVELLAGNAVDILEHTAGFLGSTLIRSDDRTTVVHHATWASVASVRALLHSPDARANVSRTMCRFLPTRSRSAKRPPGVLTRPPAAEQADRNAEAATSPAQQAGSPFGHGVVPPEPKTPPSRAT